MAKKRLIRHYEVSLFIRRRYFERPVKSCGMGPTALLPLRRNACCGFLLPPAGIELAYLGSSGKHASHYTVEDE
jgi:hypothetical protein